MKMPKAKMGCGKTVPYVLDDQVGYLMRLASQRHAAIFLKHMADGLTPTQFTTLIRVSEVGPVSQNRLGRLAAMDVATIKGVVDRLKSKGLAQSEPDPEDKRRSIISLTGKGHGLIEQLKSAGRKITQETLDPLSPEEQQSLRDLLVKIS